MEKVQSHKDLVVWKKAMDLGVEVYRLTTYFPQSENFRLVSQITRAAASVPANIAEGHARAIRRDFANFLAIAKGSLMETETYIMLAQRLKCLKAEQVTPILSLIVEISKILTSLRNKLTQ